MSYVTRVETAIEPSWSRSGKLYIGCMATEPNTTNIVAITLGAFLYSSTTAPVLCFVYNNSPTLYALYVYTKVAKCVSSIWLTQGRRLCDRPLWSDREFLDNFCTVYVSFFSRLNCKIRLPRLLMTVLVFCLLKIASKCTQTYHFEDKNDFFFWEGPSPLFTLPRRRRRHRAA